MKIEMLAECGYLSVNHVGEQLCGDNVAVVDPNEHCRIFVLADGMGSGVKANILSTLTAKMLSVMLANKVDFDECLRTVIRTLPICSERHVAYSTFTVVKVDYGYHVTVYNYDNPTPFLIHDGKSVPLDFTVVEVEGKKIQMAWFDADYEDCIVTMSDGTINAGMGVTLNYGWQLPQIMEFMEHNYRKGMSAKALATILVDRCNALYGYAPGDDTTCGVVRIRETEQVNVMFGPPVRKEDDKVMAEQFFNQEGKHIVCGGTTAKVAAAWLGKEIVPDSVNMDETIPPMSLIEGVDLVTEGLITMKRVVEYAETYLGTNSEYFNWNYSLDGASLIASALFEEATCIRFYVGCAVNDAYEEDGAVSFREKMDLTDRLIQLLNRMGKTTETIYY